MVSILLLSTKLVLPITLLRQHERLQHRLVPQLTENDNKRSAKQAETSPSGKTQEHWDCLHADCQEMRALLAKESNAA